MIKQNEKIHIAYVHAERVDAQFCFSMMDICLRFNSYIGSINCFNGLGLLAKSRNVAVKNFLEDTTDDWMMFIDTDQYLTIDGFKKLLEAADSKERPVMSALIFAAFMENNEMKPVPAIFEMNEKYGMQPYYHYPKDSVVEVFSAGTGCLLIHRSVLQKLRDVGSEQYGADWCWFQDGPIQGNLWLSEDLMFSYRLQQAGIPIHAHTGAVIPHHKGLWISEKHYEEWYEKHKDDPYSGHKEVSQVVIG